MAIAESWNGGRPACNSFRYLFEKIQVAEKRRGGWSKMLRGQVFKDPGYRLIRRGTAGLVAVSG